MTATVPSEKGETKIDPSSPKGGAKSDSDSTPQENLKMTLFAEATIAPKANLEYP